MGMRINTNIEAFNAQRNLGLTSASYAKSVEKLSSGLRINRAGDDAAGLSISEKMRAQIKGLGQAQRNAQDGISLIQTAEGALNEVHSMLQRMRELGVQASNDTLQSGDRDAVSSELQALNSEINRIATTTQFNGKVLLNGTVGGSTLAGATATDLVVGDTLATGGVAMATNVDVSAAKAATYTFTSPGAGLVTLTRSTDNVAQTVAIGAFAANASQTLNFDQLGVKISLQGDGAGTKTAANAITDLTAVANDTLIVTAGGAANLQIGANAGQNMSVAISDSQTNATGFGDGSGAGGAYTTLQAAITAITGAGNLTVAKATDLIKSLDDAIVDVSTNRGQLGAYQNRLEHTIANLGVTEENLTASESRIRDVDMADEMVNFTKTGILQQAGQAILAQANQAPQGVLSLLRG